MTVEDFARNLAAALRDRADAHRISASISWDREDRNRELDKQEVYETVAAEVLRAAGIEEGGG